MGYSFNPFTGNFDKTGAASTPGTGSTLTRENPVETPNGIIFDFTVTHEPVLVEIDGAFRVAGYGYTYVGGIISVDPLLGAPSQSVVSFYNAT